MPCRSTAHRSEHGGEPQDFAPWTAAHIAGVQVQGAKYCEEHATSIGRESTGRQPSLIVGASTSSSPRSTQSAMSAIAPEPPDVWSEAMGTALDEARAHR